MFLRSDEPSSVKNGEDCGSSGESGLSAVQQSGGGVRSVAYRIVVEICIVEICINVTCYLQAQRRPALTCNCDAGLGEFQQNPACQLVPRQTLRGKLSISREIYVRVHRGYSSSLKPSSGLSKRKRRREGKNNIEMQHDHEGQEEIGSYHRACTG